MRLTEGLGKERGVSEKRKMFRDMRIIKISPTQCQRKEGNESCMHPKSGKRPHSRRVSL